MKIVAIPFAGGDKNAFREFKKYIPSKIEWITLELPGRGRRFVSPLLKTAEEATDDLFEQLKPLISSSEPYMIYGHSMGTLMGYELTKRVLSEGLNLPVCLYFTGRGAPGAVEAEKRSNLPPDIFWEKVKNMGGLPEELLAHAELLDLYYPILSSDFKIIEEYQYTEPEKPFPIPTYITMGKDEIGEGAGKSKPEEIKMWEKETSKFCHFSELPGDHFFILKHPETMVNKIVKAFYQVLSIP